MMWWNKHDRPAGSTAMTADSGNVPGIDLTRRTLIGAGASALALASAGSITAMGPRPDAKPGALVDAEHYVLVDGWVIPGKYFRA